jgi:HD-GYP domain-containing protein (c-di-GMP phosphodiesterase class II)
MPANSLETIRYRITLALVMLQGVGTLLIAVAEASAGPLTGPQSVILGAAAFASISAATLYWRGWEPARYLAVALFALYSAFLMPEPFVSSYAPLLLMVAPALALLLTDAAWVAGVAAMQLLVLLWRAGWEGVYAAPTTVILYLLVTGALVLSRLLTDAALRYLLAQMQRAERHERQAYQRLANVQALRAVDQAITTGHDLELTLSVVLLQVTERLKVDAAAVLLLAGPERQLVFAAERGFHTQALRHTRLRLGEGYAGRVALERTLVFVKNIAEQPGAFTRSQLLASEQFVTYCGVPLLVGGQVKGVLEVFHRSPLDADPEWYDFLETLAGQAAIALDNAELFERLRQSNSELTRAYDATIEGWSRALDLRDQETEGHSQRVTELTLRLARRLQIPEEGLVHIRRGALLHDIGKMGIPDSILLKPAPLSEEEWAVMRMHPVYAYELLAPIAFLREALDIPYCHHERWDGNGYPRGIKGETIPLAARIFAVADVWDALSSNRPYRPAWSRERVLAFFAAESGSQFDPRAVAALLAEVALEDVAG